VRKKQAHIKKRDFDQAADAFSEGKRLALP